MSLKWVSLRGPIFPHFYFTCCAALFVFGCTTQRENPLVQPEKFAAIYTTLQIAAAQDSNITVKMDSILRQQGYTRVQFDEAVRYYNTNAEAWAKVVEQNVARLDSLVRADVKQDSLRERAGAAHSP